jgi:secernin
MCDSLVAVGDRTRAGTTLFAKNSDRKGDECQPFVSFPAASHTPGSRLTCTHITIDQAPETYAVMGHSPWWVWGFEHGVNEHGVAIGNETVFSREPAETTPGLIGMDLVRLGLERGATAHEAVDVITSLLEAHGQGGAAMAPDGGPYSNGFLIADPGEAWVVETSNRRWAARRSALTSVSNHITLGADWDIASADLDRFAREAGWWEAPGRVDLSGAYRNTDVPGWLSEGRLRRSRELLTSACGDIDIAFMQRALRDHAGSPFHRPGAALDSEAYYTLCMHSEPVSTTTASIVAPLPRTRVAPWPVWISFSTPCTGVFVPVYLDAAIPELLSDTSTAGAWHTFDRLRRAASTDFAKWTPHLRDTWACFEADIEAKRLAVEAAGDPKQLAELVADIATRAVELAGRLTDEITRA